MIRSFRDADTEALFKSDPTRATPPDPRVRPPRAFPADIIRRARRKLAMLHAATCVEDLRSPPGNRLEVLRGDRAGQHSIRVNQQYRICFVWRDGHAYQAELTNHYA